MGNTVLESTGLGSTQKRIRYCVSGTYICDGIEHITGYSSRLAYVTKWRSTVATPVEGVSSIKSD